VGSAIVAAIDKARRDVGERRRGHLGASSIGGRCLRQAWYGFRWAYEEKHIGRLKRLFDRGHEEEFRFNRYLRSAGFEVLDYSERLVWHHGSGSWATLPWDADPNPVDDLVDVSEDAAHIALATAAGQGPKQWSFKDHRGHFAGSSDGMIRGPGLPEGWGGLEEKTHSDKSFKSLIKSGVLTSKPVHYVQMQIYMNYFGLTWTLYLAVNKNDDELYAEIVYYKKEVALFHVDNAKKVVESRLPPMRITEDPSWFECKFCAFREICHYHTSPEKNCRSCAFAETADDGKWHCNKFNSILPDDFLPKGCAEWDPIK
jgi:hypothetical protein